MEYGILNETGELKLDDKPEEMIEIDGKKWSKSTIKEALKVHAK